MTMRLASVLLVVGAALADAVGSHSLAYYALVVAVPLVALAALSALGDVLDGTAAEPHDRGMAASPPLPLVLLAAAVRAPLLADGPPPAIRSRQSSPASRYSPCRRCSLRRGPSRTSASAPPSAPITPSPRAEGQARHTSRQVDQRLHEDERPTVTPTQTRTRSGAPRVSRQRTARDHRPQAELRPR
jgi:hypothetical protein